VKSKVKCLLINFFKIKRKVHKELLRLREHVRRLRPELWPQKTKLAVVLRQRTVSHFIFH
jgi:hypothetical protein